MKKYRFKLENLLKVRTSMEERKSLELSFAIFQYESHKVLVSQLTSERRDINREFLRKQSLRISAKKMTFYTNYLEELDSKIREQKAKEKALLKLVEKKQEDYLEARKKRKVVEELKSEGFKRYIKEMTRLEQIFIDEIASNRYNQLSSDECQMTSDASQQSPVTNQQSPVTNQQSPVTNIKRG